MFNIKYCAFIKKKSTFDNIIMKLFMLMFLLNIRSLSSLDIKTYCDAKLISVSEISLLSDSPANVFYQPASLKNGLSFSHSNPYGFTEINLMQLSFQQKIHNYAIGFGTYLYSNAKISDGQLYCSYSYLYNHLQAGLLLRYLDKKVKNYSRNNILLADIGFIWNNNNFKHGLSYSNITQSKTKHFEINSLIKFETIFVISNYSEFGVSFEKEQDFDYRYAFASSIKFYKDNKINMGFMSNPAQFSTGLDISVNNKSITYAIRTHQELDLTHSLGIVYTF